MEDFKNLLHDDKRDITALMEKITDLISFCNENNVTFCKMSFVHYLKSEKRLIVRIHRSLGSIDVKLD